MDDYDAVQKQQREKQLLKKHKMEIFFVVLKGSSLKTPE